MSESDKTYWTDDPELVEKYVLGKISDVECQRLDAEIADCEPCKEKLRQEMELAAGIRRYGRDTMKASLKIKLRREQSTQIFRYQWISFAAAVVVIAIGVGVYRMWFGDLVAPTKFGNKEIVFKQTESPNKPLEEKDKSKESESLKKEEAQVKEPNRRSARPSRVEERASDVAIAESAPAQTQKPTIADQAQSNQGAGSTQQHVEGKFKKIEAEQPTRSIWLIGSVTMVSEKSRQGLQEQTSPRALGLKEEQQKNDNAGRDQNKTLIVKRGKVDKNLVLQQRPFKSLPRSRQSQMSSQRHAETLIEESGSSLSLTIFNDALSPEDLEQAVIERSTDDSLVIALPNQRISYRIPSGWNEQQRPLRR
ncbi:MAG: hypothetical protein PHP42_05295 [Bacteroidota bacterium]|nr:hypothetical protein [Bacteroidota bacterium]